MSTNMDLLGLNGLEGLYEADTRELLILKHPKQTLTSLSTCGIDLSIAVSQRVGCRTRPHRDGSPAPGRCFGRVA